MLLCDIGNTSYHFLEKDNDYKKNVKRFSPSSVKEKIYYISVNIKVNILLKDLENWIDLAPFVDKKNYYETMGMDRIFACEAIQNGVIIDAGSAITVDIVKGGIFQGGFIYAGIKAMNQTYKNISPALDYSFNFNINLNTLPKNSQDALSYGYLKTLYNEVISYNQNIYLTGGDAKKFKHIFPEATLYNPLIFDGMKKVLREKKLEFML